MIFAGDNVKHVLRQNFTGKPVHICDKCGKDVDLDTKYEYPLKVIELEMVNNEEVLEGDNADALITKAKDQFENSGKKQRYIRGR